MPRVCMTAAQKAQSQHSAVGKSRESSKKGVARGVNPVTTDIDYSPDEVEFMRAYDAYKNRTGRMFPTLHETLGIIRDLGYKKSG